MPPPHNLKGSSKYRFKIHCFIAENPAQGLSEITSQGEILLLKDSPRPHLNIEMKTTGPSTLSPCPGLNVNYFPTDLCVGTLDFYLVMLFLDFMDLLGGWASLEEDRC